MPPTATFTASIWSWGPARNALDWALIESHHLTPTGIEATPESWAIKEAIDAITTAQNANDSNVNTYITVDLPDLKCITDPIRHYVDRVS